MAILVKDLINHLQTLDQELKVCVQYESVCNCGCRHSDTIIEEMKNLPTNILATYRDGSYHEAGIFDSKENIVVIVVQEEYQEE